MHPPQVSIPPSPDGIKVTFEVAALTSYETGLYRYGANLVRALKKEDATLQVAATFVGPILGQDATNRALFRELFGCPGLPLRYRVKRRSYAYQTTEIVRYPSRFHRGYYEIRKTLKRKTGSTNLVSTVWLRLQRELYRATARVMDFIRNLPYAEVTPVDVPDGTDIFHALYHPLPKTLANGRHPLTCQTVHDIITLLFPEFKNASFDHIIESARRADHIITISECTRRDLLSLGGFREENISVIPLAADPFFKPVDDAGVAEVRQKMRLGPEEPYFLSVSTLEPRKNFPFLLRTFREFISAPGAPPCRLLLTGRIGWGAEVNQEIAALLQELGPFVHYTGFVSDADLAALYTGAEAFLFPSLYEGFGLPVLESMACGTSVISSNAGSLPEVVGEAGVLLDPKDTRAWIVEMQRVLQRTAAEKATARTASLNRASRFSWEVTARQTLAVYEQMLARHRKEYTRAAAAVLPKEDALDLDVAGVPR